jgi:hypothetical protein
VARLARVVAIDVAHHVTQRGNRRQLIFTSDSEPLNRTLPKKNVNVPSVPDFRFSLSPIFPGALFPHDDGPNNMNNVNGTENPIRHDLGLPDRTK